MNWPNRLTLLRIVLVPIFVALVLYGNLFMAFIVFIVASLTDALDGYLARTFDQKTVFGSVMDPVADKLLLNSAYICFSVVGGLPAYLDMPIYVPVTIIGRDLIILIGIAGIYLVSGSIKIKPTVLGKITTFFQMLTIIAMLLKFYHSSWLWNVTVVLTVLSGLDYLRIGAREVNGTQ
ncbi:MAG: CDP-alcohol phosphatidyltransferase family protein [Candidatus Omnitrophica bacterium]|nr:CDP-alcohol phosphatidyltransferase family protein [Candidatus Omnitrophota bacterium]